jgi:hypothetical protein
MALWTGEDSAAKKESIRSGWRTRAYSHQFGRPGDFFNTLNQLTTPATRQTPNATVPTQANVAEFQERDCRHQRHDRGDHHDDTVGIGATSTGDHLTLGPNLDPGSEGAG